MGSGIEAGDESRPAKRRRQSKWHPPETNEPEDQLPDWLLDLVPGQSLHPIQAQVVPSFKAIRMTREQIHALVGVGGTVISEIRCHCPGSDIKLYSEQGIITINGNVDDAQRVLESRLSSPVSCPAPDVVEVDLPIDIVVDLTQNGNLLLNRLLKQATGVLVQIDEELSERYVARIVGEGPAVHKGVEALQQKVLELQKFKKDFPEAMQPFHNQKAGSQGGKSTGRLTPLTASVVSQMRKPSSQVEKFSPVPYPLNRKLGRDLPKSPSPAVVLAGFPCKPRGLAQIHIMVAPPRRCPPRWPFPPWKGVN